MAERKAFSQTSKWFSEDLREGLESGKDFKIDLGERGYHVNTEPDENGKYHVEAWVSEDRFGSNDVVGDSLKDALKNAIREDLYEAQDMAYEYAEMIDIIGYEELKPLDEQWL